LTPLHIHRVCLDQKTKREKQVFEEDKSIDKREILKGTKEKEELCFCPLAFLNGIYFSTVETL
jgi:hypothetical protein